MTQRARLLPSSAPAFYVNIIAYFRKWAFNQIMIFPGGCYFIDFYYVQNKNDGADLHEFHEKAVKNLKTTTCYDFL